MIILQDIILNVRKIYDNFYNDECSDNFIKYNWKKWLKWNLRKICHLKDEKYIEYSKKWLNKIKII